MPAQRILDYEPAPLKPAPYWRRNRVLWIIYCIGYALAVCGPVGVAAGIVSLYADPQGSLRTSVFGVPVQTVTEKLVLTVSYLLIGALGFWFLAWHSFFKRSGERTA